MPIQPDIVVKTLMQQRSQLVGYAWAVVGDPHIAEDVFQDVSMAVIRKCDQIENLEHLSRWLRHAIRLRGLEVRRKQKRADQLLSPGVLDVLEGMWAKVSTHEESDRMAALRQCVDRLHGTARQVVELRYGQNMKPADIAQTTDRRAETVYKAITRTHKALRECVERRLRAMGGGR